MLDEEMDHIIRDAVDKHHPAYNDKAWEKMEKKLDKHLPQKNDRKRFLFFLLLFLLLGGAAYFGISYYNGGKSSTGKEIAENTKADMQSQGTPPEQQPADQPATGNTSPAGNVPGKGQDNNAVPAQTPGNDLAVQNPVPAGTNAGNDPAKDNSTGKARVITGEKNKNIVTRDNKQPGNTDDAVINVTNKQHVAKKGRSNMKITASNPDEELVKNKDAGAKNKQPVQKKTNDKASITVAAAEPEADDNKSMVKTEPSTRQKENKLQAEEKKDQTKAEEQKKEKEVVKTDTKTPASPDKKKPKNNILGNFAITASAGPDLSFVSLNKLGKATLAYGAGLSYTFKNRVTLSSGFYYAKKIYSATPDQYQMPGGTAYPYLSLIRANCKVYEIPVNLSYSFGQRKNHAWFGNLGLSTLLMKSEYYNYEYKVPGGAVYNYPYEVSNQNKHYFSVLTVSAGYQYRLSKRVSLQAEPYVKLPLSGIGQGKIKLSSSGVLLTVAVKPFARNK